MCFGSRKGSECVCLCESSGDMFAFHQRRSGNFSNVRLSGDNWKNKTFSSSLACSSTQRQGFNRKKYENICSVDRSESFFISRISLGLFLTYNPLGCHEILITFWGSISLTSVSSLKLFIRAFISLFDVEIISFRSARMHKGQTSESSASFVSLHVLLRQYLVNSLCFMLLRFFYGFILWHIPSRQAFVM